MEIIVAGGCFWGVQHHFEKLNGVLETWAGYIGGDLPNPTYEQVCAGNTGFIEAVKIVFDENEISFADIIDVFFRVHNPTELNRQGSDVGCQYKSALFYQNAAQKEVILQKIAEYQPFFKKKITTAVLPQTPFYLAEGYHQDYIIKNGHKCPTIQSGFNDKKYYQQKLSPQLYHIARERGTEKPFSGIYNEYNKPGIYCCAVCGQKLFLSKFKYPCACGWPTFEDVIKGAVIIRKEFSYLMMRNEIICARCHSHLGHLFYDKTTQTEKRYCINSLSLVFTPQSSDDK